MPTALWEELQQHAGLTQADKRYCFGKKNQALEHSAMHTASLAKVATAEMAVAQTNLIAAACTTEAVRCATDKTAKGKEQSHATCMALIPAILAAQMPAQMPARPTPHSGRRRDRY